MPSQKQADKKAATKAEVKKVTKQKPSTSVLRGKAATTDFLTDVAINSGLPVADVKKSLEGLRKTVIRNLCESGKCRVPSLLNMRIKVQPARAAGQQIIFGKEKVIKARPAIKKIIAVPLKPLQDAI